MFCVSKILKKESGAAYIQVPPKLPIVRALFSHSIWDAGGSGSLRSESDLLDIASREDRGLLSFRERKSSCISARRAPASTLPLNGSASAM